MSKNHQFLFDVFFTIAPCLIDDKIDKSTPRIRPVSQKLRFIIENLFIAGHGFIFILIFRPRMTSMHEKSLPAASHKLFTNISHKLETHAAVQHGCYLHNYPNSPGIVF